MKLDRLRELLESRLEPAVFRESSPLELSAFSVRGEPVGYDEAMRGEYEPFPVGELWGPPWSTTWFHVQGRVPPEWASKSVVAVFDLGFMGATGFTCESLAWRDGRPWRAVDPNHRWLPVEGDAVDFYLEAAANPWATQSGAMPAPSMIELRQAPTPIFTLRQAELRVLDAEARRIALDFKALLELAEATGSEYPRVMLERFAETGDASLLSVALARPSRSTHLVTAVGHAHIDTAWLWPLREAKRKCARSFSNQLALMDEHPDYVFACSQPQHYAWMKESYPDIYGRIKEKVAAGQWEPVGAMWVEADCNLPSGESLVRQLLHGKRFFIQELGVEVKELWLPDVFGYPGSLPQLIAEAGCDRFLTQKLSWNEFNKPLHHTFIWEGIDGTRIFTHFPPADTYNGTFDAREIVRSERDFKDRAQSSHSLYLFGWGDGGGGPDPDMIEAARRLQDVDGAPRVALGRSSDFFERASAEAGELATWVGELYFELHRGTYTTQARTKRLNRLAEQALREAEMWSVAARHAYPARELHEAWHVLLVNQFHDILPGSGIDWVYEDANRDLEQVRLTGDDIAARAASLVAGRGEQLTVFNPNSHRRLEVLDLGDHLRAVEAPPCGWAVQDKAKFSPEQHVTVTERTMENDLLRVSWDSAGLLTSIWDKEAGREALQAGMRGNLLQLHDDNPKRWDAWDIDLDYRKTFTDLTMLTSQHVERSSGLRGAVRFVREFGRSRVSQLMVLDAGSRVLRFESAVDWEEDHKLLKVAFPVAVRWPEANYEIQFGHLARPTHSNTTWDLARFEVCAQRWADLGEPGYGVALLNDCKHGYDIQGSVMRLSLLRAPTHPDPTADRGWHYFTYALMPHRGDFRQAGVIQAAADLNSQLRVVRGGLQPGLERSLFEVSTPQVVIESMKRAEDSDAVIVRLYEAWGGRCHVTLRTSLPVRKASLCDLLERDRRTVPARDGEMTLTLTPFKILTLKLELDEAK